jgi:ectoine hydroxylase-related dioxygenase (phytanoyl-CoA dioxygenase family)
LNNAAKASFSIKEEFEEQGYIEVPDALTAQQVERLVAAIDKLTARAPDRIHNVADIFGKHDAFLELLDLPTVLPTVIELLGKNIWVNHSHFNANPATEERDITAFNNGYGWHRDGGAIHQDLPWPPPLLALKVGYYLTDLTRPGSGQTYFIRDSHKTGEKTPGKNELPDSAFPMSVKAGTAVLFDRRLIHSIRSANYSGVKRRVIFVQYAFRWMAANDAMNVKHLGKKLNPVQQQLLGLTTSIMTVDGAEGRSGRYYPSKAELPLAHPDDFQSRSRLRSLARSLLQPFKRF